MPPQPPPSPAAGMSGTGSANRGTALPISPAIATTVWQAMQAVGAPVWNENAKAVAREIQIGLGMDPMSEPFIDEMSRLIDPQEAEAILRRDLPPSQLNSTSDDYTDMTWHAPTARFYVARPALRAPAGQAYPAWVMNALGGIPATIDPMVQTAAKIPGAVDLAPAGRSSRPRRGHGRVQDAHRRRDRRQPMDPTFVRLSRPHPFSLA